MNFGLLKKMIRFRLDAAAFRCLSWIETLILAYLVMVAFPSWTLAQTSSTSNTDGLTPLGLSPGTPAGSYALSDLDNINLYNGNLSFRVPLLHIPGRGGAQMTIYGKVEQKWRVRTVEVAPSAFVHHPDPNWWIPREVGYGPGVLYGRHSGTDPVNCFGSQYAYDQSLTRFTFTAADGTEFELRDALTDGEPKQTGCNNPAQPVFRGNKFVTNDGTSATFISDTDIYDPYIGPPGSFLYPYGYLMLRDGTRYRVEDGLVKWIRDRNGNKLTFDYDLTYHRVTQITDSMNRQVTITYKSYPSIPYDQITYKGYGGNPRTVRVIYSPLRQSLRSDFSSTLTFDLLFPELNGASSSTDFNPPVVSSIEIPDGRSYRVFYNPYGEIARVELPTGGAYEYDHDGGLTNGNPSGVIGWEYTYLSLYSIYRRVVERRVYPDGVTLEQRTTYGKSEQASSSNPSNPGSPDHVVEVQHFDANLIRVGDEIHKFDFGSPANSFFDGPTSYPGYKDGRETGTERRLANGTVVQVINTSDWGQRTVVPWHLTQDNYQPPKDPRLLSSTTTLSDTNQVSKQEFGYDAYNNVKVLKDYDFGPGSPGPLLRRTDKTYLTTANGYQYDLDTNIHIRNLPALMTVSADLGGSNLVAKTVYEYDLAALTDRPGISGLDENFTTSYAPRGNLTHTARYASSSSISNTTMAYDIAGNLVQATDPRGKITNVYFDDRFGYPNGEARSSISPTELGSNAGYAFPTSVSNPKGHTTYTQYDFWTGKPVDFEDANGVVSSFAFNDILDRLTQTIRANSDPTIRNQTSFSYNDSTNTVTTTKDKDNYTDYLLRSEAVFDGLGRLVESRQYEGGTDMIAVRRLYDAMGRAYKVSNPFRPNREGPSWTTTSYDGLSRASEIETEWDQAQVATSYQGNATTVTDQAGNPRRSLTDGLGRLVRVDEPDANKNLGSVPSPFQATSYTYDALDNLTGVSQGGQVRSFSYDWLSRLLTATNPESGSLSYQYDLSGNMTQKTDARGVITSFGTYDELNRPTTKSYSDGTPMVTYTYDPAGAKGRLASVSSSVSSTSFQYDPLGRITQSTQTTDAIPYSSTNTYDLADHLRSQTYPSGRVVTSGYDSAGRLNLITGQKLNEPDKTYASQFSYAAHGAVAAVKLGNELWEYALFNGRMQPYESGLGAYGGSSSLFKLEYEYVKNGFPATTNNGNMSLERITAPDPGGIPKVITQSYDYDSLNRLSTASEASAGTAWSQTYTYDRYGNRAVTVGAGHGQMPSLTPTALAAFSTGNNRIIASGYDNAGNMTQDTVGRIFTYDAENHQKTFDGGMGNTAQYLYDGDGKRIKKIQGGVTTLYVYNAFGHLIAEYSDHPSSSGGTTYLTTDHLGSTRVVTDASKQVRSRHDYLPFGDEISSGYGNRSTLTGYNASGGIANLNLKQKFTAKERDTESNLDYFGARYFAAAYGRFLSVDPLLFSGRKVNPQTLNRYSYVLNRPKVGIDPDGLATLLVTVGSGNRPAATSTLFRKDGMVASYSSHYVEFAGLATGAGGRNRLKVNADTPFGVYRNGGVQGGTATSRLGSGFGTGKVILNEVAGEPLLANPKRTSIRIHGGSSVPNDAYLPNQRLTGTYGCIRLCNEDVNSLIGAIVTLPPDDPLDYIYIGDEDYLYELAHETDESGNYRYQDLRIVLGIQAPENNPDFSFFRLFDLMLENIRKNSEKSYEFPQ